MLITIFTFHSMKTAEPETWQILRSGGLPAVGLGLRLASLSLPVADGHLLGKHPHLKILWM